MEKIVKFSITCFCLFSFAFSYGQKVEVKINGIYQSEPYETKISGESITSWQFLRFFPDSTIIFMNSTEKPDQVIKWLTKDNAYLDKGVYEVTNDSISCQTKGVNGNISYSGKVDENKLVLQHELYNTGHMITTVFNFIETSSEKKE